jgi:phage terminase large subunit-like protein
MLSAQELAKNSLQRAGYQFYTVQEQPPETFPPPVEWIEQNFYLYDTGNLITLYDCQRRPLELALSRDAAGLFRYTTILWSWPKKSAKSSVIASVADFTASSRNRASVKLVANDLKQADSRVGMYLRESIKLGQKADHRDKAIRMTPSGYTTKYPNGSIIECVPIDPSGEAGGNDDMIVYSELHGWKSKAHQRMWTEMTLSPNKFGNSQRWIDTYAGFEGESPILEQLYQVGVKQGTRVWDDLEVYTNDQARMLTVWVTKPMLPWQTNASGQEYYAAEEAQLAPNEFLRIHRNQWVSSEDVFVPYEWWEACNTEYTAVQSDEPVIIALDAGVSSDCFAVVMVTRRDSKVQVQYTRKWQPANGQKLDFAPIEAEIRRLVNTYNVMELCYDPYQLVDMMGRVRSEEAVNVREFNQASPRAIADKRLFDLILARNVQHKNDADLNSHVKAANRKADDDNKLRIIKRTPEGKIDLTVALSMAADRSFAYAFD